ncbi:MAG: DUF488 family protein [Gammaproteobacteria bacterium]|jgi:uncharacterized protein YeaO (DUF488 family)|nr:DUF488 family protein [Gammaproteobacteria bacterium]MBU0772065.1 DUF488 family protein [Gammaproteobacteria bacterium]MBU0856386.1 DUF488 family protein [Gammaproteobacteria bacterium]MBU1845856.1 DUF488 family protein [Gammaproteobacteria bacterium]
MTILVKRAYEPPGAADGFRILVDRLWPRGVSRQDAHVDLWLRDAAPSASLRKWFGHDPAKWAGFRQRYFLELAGRPEVIAQLEAQMDRGVVTLVYGARDTVHNNAVALKAYLEDAGRRASAGAC